MYLDYFGLSEAPFSITPDPTFVYLSPRHRDALAHLLYGVGQGGAGGFVQLTGEVGTGKTTLCRCLLEQVPEGTHIALVLNPLMTPLELLEAICEELGVGVTDAVGSSKVLVDRLNQYLLNVHRSGERVVVVIDEAQNLSPEALEQVRLLTNLETSKEKLLQVILLGQPELRELLRRRSLRQLAQRITARYHLTPLSPEDTALYVRHRMQVGGAERNPFRRSAMRVLYQRSSGVPRLINIIADRALVGAYARERHTIDGRQIHAAADEVQLGEPGVTRPRWPWVAGAAAVLALALLAWRMVGVQAPGTSDAAVAAVEEKPAGPDVTQLEAHDPPFTETEPVQAAAKQDPQPPPEVLAWQWLEVQNELAWRGISAAWGKPGDAALIEATCLGSQGLGYACLRDQGNWARIEKLGLPVVLVLHGEDLSHLVLTGIEGNELMVGAGADARIVQRSQVEPLWLGTYVVAWPQSPNWPREVGRGDSGPAVETIMLMAANAEPPYQGEQVFDEAFESWLVQFQVSNGLDPDGIVGPKTLLYLMRYSIEEPRLAVRREVGR